MNILLLNILESDLSISIDNLGLGSIAAVLREEEIDVTLSYLKPCNINEDYIKEFSKFNIVGFTLNIENTSFVYKAARILKTLFPDVFLIVGGHLATNAAEYILDDCKELDCVVLGAGEFVTLELIECLKNHGDITLLPHIKTREDNTLKTVATVDTSSLPSPARDNLLSSLQHGEKVARLYSSRGCCSNCSFCSVKQINKKWQGRNLEEIFNELICIYEKYKIRSFIFSDSSFEDPGILGKKRINDLCDLLLEYPVKFSIWCCFRADSFTQDDIPLLEKMKKAGISQAFIGIEAANEQDLKFYNKKATVEDNIKTMKLFSDAGISAFIGFIMLNPYSDENTLYENYKFLSNAGVYTIGHYASQLAIFYQSAIHKKLINTKYLNSDFTYLTPYNYSFKNEYAGNVSKFIMETGMLNSIVDINLITVGNIVLNLHSIYGHEAEKYLELFNEYAKSAAKLVSEYFKIIYEELNLNKAKEMYPSFNEEYLKIFNKTKLLKYKIIKDGRFNEYFDYRK